MWEAIILAVLKFAAWGLEKLGASEKQKKKFFEFVKKAGQDRGSVNIYKWAEAQRKQFKDEPFKPEPGQVQTMEKKIGAFSNSKKK